MSFAALVEQVHDNPAVAKCDALLQTPLHQLERLTRRWLHLAAAYKECS